MAGTGPAPKASHARARNDVARETIKSDGRLGGWPLPANALGTDRKTGEVIEWNEQTLAWWEAFRASPQGTRMVTEVDWHFLLDTALMHHTMWANGRWEFAAEIRLRVAKFGATPEDRARLKFDIEVPEQYPVGHGGDDVNVTRMDDRRNRWAN